MDTSDGEKKVMKKKRKERVANKERSFRRDSAPVPERELEKQRVRKGSTKKEEVIPKKLLQYIAAN